MNLTRWFFLSSRCRITVGLALAGLASCAEPERPDPLTFTELAVLDVGRNPHQIAFSADGSTAYVAASGFDQIVRVDVAGLMVTGTMEVPDSPLGVKVLPGDGRLMVTSFAGEGVGRAEFGGVTEWIETGVGSSIYHGPIPGAGPVPEGIYLLSTEQENRLSLVDGADFSIVASYETGNRPFPPGTTSDGRLAFVPNYDDGTVTVVDLWNERIAATTPVGERPSGGAVIPWDIDYAVAVRGENKIAFINTASWEVTDTLTEGIGEEPFSVVVAPNGRLAFVNNTASHDISVIDLSSKEVITRIPVGEIPIVMAAHPSGETLWVSSEGSHTLTVLEIPEYWRSPDPRFEHQDDVITEVAVMGMIHGTHRRSERWGLGQVRETIRNLDPDVVCIEIPPNRWDRIWTDYSERGVFEDLRIRPFPEYTDVLLPLTAELDFEIVPCAGWTKEMNDLRSTQTRVFNESAEWAGIREEFRAATAAVQQQVGPAPEGSGDDPHYIHSDEYDDRLRITYGPRAEYQNDMIGPGGWININNAHMALIEKTIQENRGKRILVTFGAGHKYWYMDALRDRRDVRLVDIREFLPGG